MRNKYFLSALILSISIGAAAFIVADGVSAQAPMVNPSAANIQYPVAELGNCGSEAECKTYCDDTTHLSACLAFAEKKGLMSQEELKTAKQFAKVGSKGPGGCTGKESCDKYCDDVSHIDACVSFAEQNGMLSGKELEEAKKVQAAIAKGVKPPACGGKKACDQYCSEAAHMEECITFGQAAGFMSEQELQDSQKMLVAIKKGAKPPACRGREECDQYCSDAAHMEECMTFAAAAGFMSEQEAQDSQKMLAAIKKGAKPPACKGKEECDKYCGEEGHMDECVTFAEAAGFMKPDEAAMARKTGGKGPGGCKGKEVCEAFCNNPDNQETCFNFGRDNGMIPPEELQKMEQGKQQFSQSISQAPAEVINCISGVVGADRLEKFRSGAAMPTRDIGDKIGGCFQQMMGPGGPGEGGMMPPAGQTGPGGCKTPEECQSYCTSNPEACKNLGGPQGQPGQFQPGPGVTNPGGQMMPQQAGPGGCKTPEECQSFCMSNPDTCKNFKPVDGQDSRAGGGAGGGSERRGTMPDGTPGKPCEGDNCAQPSCPPGQVCEPTAPSASGGSRGQMMQGKTPPCAPGTQCGPGSSNTPGGQGMGMSGGETQQFAPPSGEGMMPPSGSGPMQQQLQQQIQQQVQQQVQQLQQQFQQEPQQFQQPPSPPPPPAGGSFFKTVKSFLGL
ncbi:MAG: hypothetical protein V1696_02975 [Candidatus Jorgensenbacteria bacterium]